MFDLVQIRRREKSEPSGEPKFAHRRQLVGHRLPAYVDLRLSGRATSRVYLSVLGSTSIGSYPTDRYTFRESLDSPTGATTYSPAKDIRYTAAPKP